MTGSVSRKPERGGAPPSEGTATGVSVATATVVRGGPIVSTTSASSGVRTRCTFSRAGARPLPGTTMSSTWPLAGSLRASRCGVPGRSSRGTATITTSAERADSTFCGVIEDSR